MRLSWLRPFDHENLQKRAEECERLGRENSLPLLWAFVAPMSYGLALLREGKVAEGIAPSRLASCFGKRAAAMSAQNRKALLAEAMALTGDLDDALKLIDEIIGQIERPGWEERLH